MNGRGSRTPLMLFFLREAARNIRAVPWLTLCAVLTIALSLLLVGIFGFVMVNGDALMSAVQQDLRITVYLEEEVDNETVGKLIDALKERNSEIEAVFPVSADEDRARNRLLLTSELSPELLVGLDEEAFPGQPCLDVQLRTRERRMEDFEELGSWLKGFEGVESVQEVYIDAEKLRLIFSIIDLVRVTGLIVCLLVLAAALFFSFSTIKLVVYSRREEIEILRLVGATNGFIRAPFYLEGALSGLLGSATALVIVASIYGYLDNFRAEVHAIDIRIEAMPASMMLWMLLGGVLLGLAGSALSVRRHLKT